MNAHAEITRRYGGLLRGSVLGGSTVPAKRHIFSSAGVCEDGQVKSASLDKSFFLLCPKEVDRHRPSLRLGIAATVIACSVAGCAMSQQSFARLAAGVSERNEQRYRAAEAELRTRGYVFVDDEQLYATLDEQARRRCLDAAYRGQPEPTTASEPMLVRVATASRADRPPPVPIELSAAAEDACQFFRARIDQLDGRRPDGNVARIIRIGDGVRLARGRHGDIAVVAVSPRVVSRRSVLVKRSCDHMPRPEPDPLERSIHTRVVLASTPPPRVEMVVEEEMLDVKCTENTY